MRVCGALYIGEWCVVQLYGEVCRVWCGCLLSEVCVVCGCMVWFADGRPVEALMTVPAARALSLLWRLRTCGVGRHF